MRVADGRFLVQLCEPTPDQRAQRLVVERCVAQEIRCAHRSFQLRDRLEKFRLTRGAFSQFFNFLIVDLARRPHEQLFLPSYFRASNDLR